jgi:hypothetical protein
VVEEPGQVGARVHLPSRRSRARVGNEKRAKSDRADARQLSELLMIGQESCPDRVVDCHGANENWLTVPCDGSRSDARYAAGGISIRVGTGNQ